MKCGVFEIERIEWEWFSGERKFSFIAFNFEVERFFFVGSPGV